MAAPIATAAAAAYAQAAKTAGPTAVRDRVIQAYQDILRMPI